MTLPPLWLVAGADGEAEALPIEGGGLNAGVPERGREDRDLGVVICEPDRVRGRPRTESGRPHQGGGWRSTGCRMEVDWMEVD